MKSRIIYVCVCVCVWGGYIRRTFVSLPQFFCLSHSSKLVIFLDEEEVLMKKICFINSEENPQKCVISSVLIRMLFAATKSLQSCPTLCDPIDGSPPGSPVPGILQARTLEWVAVSFSRCSLLWNKLDLGQCYSFKPCLSPPWRAFIPTMFPVVHLSFYLKGYHYSFQSSSFK